RISDVIERTRSFAPMNLWVHAAGCRGHYGGPTPPPVAARPFRRRGRRFAGRIDERKEDGGQRSTAERAPIGARPGGPGPARDRAARVRLGHRRVPAAAVAGRTRRTGPG